MTPGTRWPGEPFAVLVVLRHRPKASLERGVAGHEHRPGPGELGDVDRWDCDQGRLRHRGRETAADLRGKAVFVEYPA